MVEIGSVISARVTRVEPYGVFLEHDGQTVVVLRPEIAWSSEDELPQRIQPGQTYEVLVLRYNYRDHCLVGSMRRLHPEQNPYRELSRLEPGTVLRGVVQNVIGDEITVQLPNGAWGHVPRRSLSTDAGKGDELEVIISALEVEEGRLSLEPARRHPPARSGPDTPVPTEQTA